MTALLFMSHGTRLIRALSVGVKRGLAFALATSEEKKSHDTLNLERQHPKQAAPSWSGSFKKTVRSQPDKGVTQRHIGLSPGMLQGDCLSKRQPGQHKNLPKALGGRRLGSLLYGIS